MCENRLGYQPHGFLTISAAKFISVEEISLWQLLILWGLGWTEKNIWYVSVLFCDVQKKQVVMYKNFFFCAQGCMIWLKQNHITFSDRYCFCNMIITSVSDHVCITISMMWILLRSVLDKHVSCIYRTCFVHQDISAALHYYTLQSQIWPLSKKNKTMQFLTHSPLVPNVKIP